jgi:hypothetical protein
MRLNSEISIPAIQWMTLKARLINIDFGILILGRINVAVFSTS